jgi:hypothetical protein
MFRHPSNGRPEKIAEAPRTGLAAQAELFNAMACRGLRAVPRYPRFRIG